MPSTTTSRSNDYAYATFSPTPILLASSKEHRMNRAVETSLSKVPAVTLGFWIIKIAAATTLGETAGDAVTMTLDLEYLIGTVIFATIFVIAVAAQITARRFHPFLCS